VGHVPHDLIIPKADNASTGSGQVLNPNADKTGIFFLLQVMDIPIHFNNQRRLVTVKVDDRPSTLDVFCHNMIK